MPTARKLLKLKTEQGHPLASKIDFVWRHLSWAYPIKNKGRRPAILSIEARRNSIYIYMLRNLLVKYQQTLDLASKDAQARKNASVFDSIGTWCWHGWSGPPMRFLDVLGAAVVIPAATGWAGSLAVGGPFIRWRYGDGVWAAGLRRGIKMGICSERGSSFVAAPPILQMPEPKSFRLYPAVAVLRYRLMLLQKFKTPRFIRINHGRHIVVWLNELGTRLAKELPPSAHALALPCVLVQCVIWNRRTFVGKPQFGNNRRVVYNPGLRSASESHYGMRYV